VAAIAAALPIQLSDLAAARTATGVNLRWTSILEQNVAYFSVERSLDAVQWLAIGTITATGNSTSSRNYTYADVQASSAKMQYRLVTVDVDGKKWYSSVQAVPALLQATISVYPNPANNQLSITLPAAYGNCKISLLSANGTVLQEQKAVSGSSKVTIDVAKYAPGLYLLQITDANGATSSSSIMLQH